MKQPQNPIINAWRLACDGAEPMFTAYLSGGGLVSGRYSLPLHVVDRAGDSALDLLVEAALAGTAKLVAWRGR